MCAKKIKNVALLGHSGSGKTSFAENMLFEAKAINRIGKVEDKTTISDYTQIEQERGNSLFASLMHVDWKDSKINIIDTPGLDDFVGEVISALKVADTGVMLINAQSGVEVGTELIWEYVERFKTPALFVINQLDSDKANFDNSLEQVQSRFGRNVLPMQFPVNQGASFNKIVDALRMTMYVFDEKGGKPKKEEIPEEHLERAQKMHNDLVEAAAENDDALMEKFFEDGTLLEDELAQGLTIAMANQKIFPVFCASSEKNMGSGRIMGFINDIAPSPADRPEAVLENGETIACDPNGDTAIFIYKTISEPNVGNLSYFKVYSGTLNSSDDLINAQTGSQERFNQLFVANGKNRDSVDKLVAGDLGVTVKLKDSHSNNSLNVKGKDRKIEPMHFPEPRIRLAVKPPSKSDLEKMAAALHTIQEEDPTLIMEQSQELKQTILHGQGELHLDLLKYRIGKVYGINIEYMKPRIPYRETILKRADSNYRHKKQSGGSGQFGEVHMRIEPYYEGMPEPEGLNVRKTDIEELPWGGHLAFYWCIVGGSIDTRFANAIKKGVMMKMEDGPLTGSYCRDIRVSVYDGKMHPVDSNDMAFQIAGTMVFRNAFREASPQILEPVYNLEVLCEGDVMGDVMGDLQTRRAIIQGMDAEGHYQKISAKVPLAELYKYSSTLRSITQGKAKFHMAYSEYSPVPHDVQAKLIAEHQEELQEA